MKFSSLKNQLSSLRTREEFGAVSPQKLEEGRTALLRTIGEVEMAHPVYTWTHKADFVLDFALQSVARPMAVGFTAVMLTLGGWVAAVNASSESVPGDTLYPVKMAAEKIHLTLTTSSEQRAKLQLEFAGRRLAEIKNVRASNRSGKQVRVQSAVQQFRKEMASVNSHLDSVAQGNSGDAAALVELVGEKTNAYAATIREDVASTSDVRSSEEVLQDVRAAEQDVIAVGQKAVETLVEQQEAMPDGDDEEELQNVFRTNLNDLQARVAVVKARLATIEVALRRGDVDQALRGDAYALVSKIRVNLILVQPDLDDAVDSLAAGGFRSTFNTLARLQSTMSVVSDLLIQLEVGISSPAPSKEE